MRGVSTQAEAPAQPAGFLSSFWRWLNTAEENDRKVSGGGEGKGRKGRERSVEGKGGKGKEGGRGRGEKEVWMNGKQCYDKGLPSLNMISNPIQSSVVAE